MPINKIAEFLRLEAAGGVLLFFMAVIAIVWVNSPFQPYYAAWVHDPLQLHIGNIVINQSLTFWVNDGLMALFFLLVGLELKREFIEGELSGLSKIVLPGLAALGGMIIPAVMYVGLNHQAADALPGWAIPVATDIAFALGVLSFFSRRIPLSLKLFLLALAVFDDLGAIIIIALFYSHGFSWLYFLLAVITLGVLWLLNSLFSTKKLLPYLLLGALLWFFVLRSGIHPSVSGVLLAAVIPLRQPNHRATPPLHYLESALHPWVVFFILPLFALVNSGLSFAGFSLASFAQPIVLGIIFGLWLGKQVGVLTFVWLSTRLGWAKLPESATWWEVYGVALLCGIGFTMSLFLGTLAFQDAHPAYMMEVRLGVFAGSVLSAVTGSLVLHVATRVKRKKEALH